MADVESLARVGQRSRRIPNHIDVIMLWEILARETLGPRTPTTVIMILTFQISLFAQLRFFSFIFFFTKNIATCLRSDVFLEIFMVFLTGVGGKFLLKMKNFHISEIVFANCIDEETLSINLSFKRLDSGSFEK